MGREAAAAMRAQMRSSDEERGRPTLIHARIGEGRLEMTQDEIAESRACTEQERRMFQRVAKVVNAMTHPSQGALRKFERHYGLVQDQEQQEQGHERNSGSRSEMEMEVEVEVEVAMAAVVASA